MKITKKIQRLTIILVTLLMTTASWGQTYTVSIETATGGEVTGTMSAKYGTTDIVSGSTAVNPGGTVTLTASPASGYYLSALNVEAYSDAGYAAGRTRTIPNTPTMTGSVPVTQTGANTYTFTMPVGYVKVTPTFSESTDLSTATILLTEGTPDGSGNYSRVYDWVSHTPVIASVKIGENVLTKNVDYTEAAISSIENVGSVTIRVDGKGIYKGSRQITYSITQRSLSSDTYITLGYETTVYNKSEQKPSVAVQTGGHTLTVSSDYTVGYSVVQSGDDFIKPGTKRITITGTGNFTGSTSKDYTITPKPITSSDISVTQNGTSFTYNGNPQYPTITVTDGEGSPYTLQYGSTKDYTLNWSSGGAVEHPTGTNSTAVGNYSVTVSGTNNYTGSVTKQYTINASNSGYYIVYKNGSGYSITDHNETYTGSEITLVPGTRTDPATTNMIVMKMAGSTPAPATDEVLAPANYELAYTNNINSGWATVTAIGKAGYSFVASNKFKIEPKSVDGLTITLSSSSFEYNGKVQKPEVTVKDGDTPLYLGRDYELTNDGGKDVGTTYKATIKGIGNYTGTKNSDNYSITQKSLSTANITLSTTRLVYDGGNAKKPEVTLVMTTDGVVANKNEYEVTWANHNDAATPNSTNKPTVTVTAKTDGNFTGSKSVYYTIEPKTITSDMVKLSNNSFTFNNQLQAPTVTVDYQYLPDASPTTPATKTLIVDTDYTLTNAGGTAVGIYYATVVGKGNYTGTINAPYSIVSDNDEDGIDITLDTTYDYTYNGSPKKPGVTVKKGATITLDGTDNKDYELVYNNNINAGQASVTVIGKGNYHFVKNQEFAITKRNITNEPDTKISIALSPTTFTYNGNKQRPAVTVTDTYAPAGSQVLIENKDYTLSEGNINVANNYTVTVKGIGNYEGTKTTTTYSITPLEITSTNTIVTLSYNSTIYDKTAQTPVIEKVTVDGIQLKQGTDYTPAFPTDDAINAGEKTITITGTGNFSGSKDVNYTIKPKEITSSMITLASSDQTNDKFVNNSFTYNGSAHHLNVTVKDGTTTLVQSTATETKDYKLTNADQTAVGVYYVKVEGEGNYTGTVEMPYSIVSDNADAGVVVTLGATDNLVYTGSPITRTITVVKNSKTLTEGKEHDYEVVYNNNTNVGEATVSIIGRNNYNFVVHEKFNITAKSLTAAMVSLLGVPTGGFVYTGSVQRPIVVLNDADRPATLVENVDYKLTNNGAVNVGTGYTASIEGTGNYKGTVSSPTYQIVKRPISSAVVSLVPMADPTYDGSQKRPTVEKITVTDNNVDYVFTSGFTVDYVNNINASTTAPTVNVTGANFEGTATAKFTITPKPLSSSMITLLGENVDATHPSGVGFVNNSFTYDGQLHKPTVKVMNGNTELSSTTDYTLTNDGGTAAGTYSVSITGKGNYTGSASKEYFILSGGSAGFTIADIDDQVYTGTEIKPTLTVTGNSTTPLTEGNDYDVTFSNNINVGIATVFVIGKGNYSGMKSTTFRITPKSLSATMISLTSNSFTYNGSIQKPSVIISDGGFLHESDYTVVNDGGLNAGDYHVSVTGRGNYTGTITGVAQTKYTINKLSISEANITLNTLDSYVYNGNNKTPGVSLVTIGSLNVPSSGYTIAYSNNKNASTTTSKATVTITGQGNFKDEASTTFSITPKAVSDDMISFNKEIFVFNGGSQKPEVTVKDGNTLLSSTNDYTLNNDGGIEAGLYYVTITGKGNYTGTAKRSYNIITLGASIFSVSGLSDKEYNGSEYTPEPVVVNDDTHAQLTKGTDYTVSYLNNKNVGTATVTVTGIGSYAGTISRTFKITPKSLTPEMVTLSASSFSFNSLVQSPTVTVSDGTIMTDNDYTITNNGGIGCGTYHVIVTGKGNYSGQIDKTFDITQLDISNASVTLYELQSYAYDGKAKKPGVREVMVGSVTVPTTGYTISYGENINAGTATVTVTGQGDFKGSKTVNFTIEKKAVTDNMIILSNLEYTYNGNVQKPEVSVKDGETTLTLDTDYTLDNNGGVNAGVYDVKITGKGNYTGSAFKSFYINTREAGNFVVTLSEESMVYSGSELKPEVTVEDGGNALTAGKDYTVTYNDNINVEVATITVRGMGEYDGIKNKTFIIKPKEIKAEMVTLSSSGFTYNGMQQRPVVTVADGTFLTSNDYVVTNEGGINAGSYPVKVTGRNNYTGTVETSFSIGALELAEAKVILYDLANYEYDGSPKNPGVREVAVGTMVVPTSSYTTEISANVNVGTVTVTVTGTGNFAGSASTTFEILQKPITTSMITLTPDIFYYNGSTQKPAVTVKHGKLTLREGTDFTLTNNGGRDAGTYEVNVKGMGNYTDEASASYNILTSEVTIFEITLETEKYVYDGTAREPAVTVKEGERVLTAVTDYTVKYANNVNAGTATVAVIGVGDYKGSQMKEFIIEPKPMTEDMVSLDKTTFTYNEEKQKPVVTVSDGDIMTEADYTITNEGGTEVGAYEVVVKGKNNYNGTITKKYNIVRSEMPVDPKPGEEQPGDAKINVSPTEEGSNEVKVSSITTSETGDASVTIPETCTINGQTYTVTGIADGAFANASNLKDIYLPETEKPLTIGKNAIPAQANVHVPLALLAEYALMPTMAESFRNGKVMTTVKAKNRYWTFASGVDVYVPDGLDVYIAREHNGSSVSIIQLTDNDLAVGGQRVIKANNGVLINSSGNDTEYVFVACAKRMTSGTAVSTDDNKDYGLRNRLIPVIVATHFEAGNYYFMKDNEFYRIKDESEDIKVPAGKAVLYMKSANASARVRLINGTTDISSENIAEDEGEWYTLEGMKLEERPTKEGIYIHNKKKVYIRKYEK